MSQGLSRGQVLLEDQLAAAAEEVEGGYSTELLVGERALVSRMAMLQALRVKYGQADEVQSDPRYFVAANTVQNRRAAAVIIGRQSTPEASVFFFEHCRMEVGLGVFRAGDSVGDVTVIGDKASQKRYIALAARALLRHRRAHTVSLAIKATLAEGVALMGPAGPHAQFSTRTVKHKLPLESSYPALLATFGHQTRKNLTRNRRLLVGRGGATFHSSLTPEQALEAMLWLEPRALPHRTPRFHHARYVLLAEHPAFFSMALRAANGDWLSFLTGWRKNGVTFVDLQMNDKAYTKESLSSVLRSFLLEQETQIGQHLIEFVGGTSMLLRRYCRPDEPCTDILLKRPGIRSAAFSILAARFQHHTVYDRIKTGEDGPTLMSLERGKK